MRNYRIRKSDRRQPSLFQALEKSFQDGTKVISCRVQKFFGLFVFLSFLGFYSTYFYRLSPQNISEKSFMGETSAQVERRDPFAELMNPNIDTIMRLPGSVNSAETSFDSPTYVAKERDANILPGAIGLSGPFDEGGEIPVKQGVGDKGGEHDSKRATAASLSVSGKRRKRSETDTSTPKEPKVSSATRTDQKLEASRSTTRFPSNLSEGSESSPDDQKEKTGKNRMENTKRRGKHKISRDKTPKKKHRIHSAMSSANTESLDITHGGISKSQKSTGQLTKEKKKKKRKKKSKMLKKGRDDFESATSIRELSGEIHPMNRRMKSLQLEGSTGVLSENAVMSAYEKLVKAYLVPFARGIARRSFFDIMRRKTYSLTPPGANKGVQTILFQIIDRRLFLMDPYEVTKNTKPFYRSRIKELIWLLSSVAKKGSVPNTEFLLAIHDCVQTVNSEHSYRGAIFVESSPTFTIVSCNFSDNIPFPMWEGDSVRGGLERWDEKMEVYKNSDTVPWAEKKSKAVFRGGNRPSMYFKDKADANDHCDDVGRTRLLHLSESVEDMFDVKVGGSCGGKTHVLSRLSEAEHHKFKYIMYTEGNCFWADRLNKQVFGPSAIIKQETPCGQFWEPLLKPMTHYIPTDFFFLDTADQIRWAIENDEKTSRQTTLAHEKTDKTALPDPMLVNVRSHISQNLLEVEEILFFRGEVIMKNTKQEILHDYCFSTKSGKGLWPRSSATLAIHDVELVGVIMNTRDVMKLEFLWQCS